VIAFPVSWRRKLPGLAVGIVLLFALNLARIASLYMLGANRSPLLDSFHLAWWPAFFIVCSLALWVLWVLWVRRLDSDLSLAASVMSPTARRGGPSRARGA
jgi:exosortase/archaeosortase family protein